MRSPLSYDTVRSLTVHVSGSMAISLSSLTQKIPGRSLWRRVRLEVAGLLQDFWKDAPPPPPKPKTTVTVPATTKKSSEKKEKKKATKTDLPSSPATPRTVTRRWHADRFQIMEKLWGEGRALPAPAELDDLLVTPLGLTSEKDVLDLSAGLGGLPRRLAEEFNAAVTALETDALMARRATSLSLDAAKGKKIPVEFYDPPGFSPPRKYDAVIARELFYRVIGKEKFFQAVAGGVKQHGMLVFTDYLLDKKARENKAVSVWNKYEPHALPMNLQDMIESWSKLKFDVRANEDLTDLYLSEIAQRLKAFTGFLAQTPPDADTRPLVLQEIELWVRRAEAMQQGLKFFRFEAIKV